MTGATNPADVSALALAAVATEARLAELDPANLPLTTDALLVNQQDDVGPQSLARAITATLRVSPDGDGTDGLTWATAYQTPQAAFDAASTDANDCTLVLIVPATYDIDMTGNPSWAANLEVRGTHRGWGMIQNGHGTATAVMRFTGRVSITDITINPGATAIDGVIITSDSPRLRRVMMECEDATGAMTGITLSGGAEHAVLEDVEVHGAVAYTTGLLLNNAPHNHFENLQLHDCLTGLQITDGLSDTNEFHHCDFHDCALGIDIDAGNGHTFDDILFSNCTRNVDDEVGDHHWSNINGAFDVAILPDDLTGVAVSTGGAGVYGSDTEILAAAGRDNPFRVVTYYFDPSTSEWYQVRLSDDSGTTFFDVLQFDANKQRGNSASSGTEHIFNRATRISASARDVSGGDTVQVWVGIQEI